MLRAVASRHKCVTHYHGAAGTGITTTFEATLSLGGSMEAISSISRIEIDGVAHEIDPVRRTIRYADHSDPAVPFHHDGRWWIQMFLCDGRFEQTLPSQVRAWSETGRSIEIAPVIHHVAAAEPDIRSTMAGTPGRRRIEFQSNDPVEIIVQTSAFGRERESVMELRQCAGSFELPPVHAERYGVCLSAGDVFGGIEHKHMIFGQSGHASGRTLVVRDGVWLPKVREQFLYRSCLVVDDGGTWIENAISDATIDELDIWTSVDGSARIRNILGASSSGRHKITTFEQASSPAAVAADVIVIGPEDEVPTDRTVSFMLFADQASMSFQTSFKTAIERILATPSSVDVVERAWIGAHDSPSLSERHFGIGFSRVSEASKSADVHLFKRLKMPSYDPCGTCRSKRSCLSFVATPLVAGLLPTKAACGIRNAFDH